MDSPPAEPQPVLPICRVATVDVLQAECVPAEDESGSVNCRLVLRCKDGSQKSFQGRGEDRESAVASGLSQLTTRPVTVHVLRHEKRADGFHVSVLARGHESERAGVGRFVAAEEQTAVAVAGLRAVSHAGLLTADYRANNQRILRDWSRQLQQEWQVLREQSTSGELEQLESEGLILEHFNRVASAAVVTAANYPRPKSILSLFDTSAWLFDAQGRRRDAYTDTDLWLAWYPGVKNDQQTIDAVIATLPAAPDSKIPWIVKFFENPTSRFRFRGAVDLEDHDVLHVLLGRGLQDQDEAFVLGFAMGTAKRISWFQYWVFKFVLSKLYPEPYRIPSYLLPAFDLGVRCGQETGSKNLYRSQLKQLRGCNLRTARERAGIDMDVVLRYYELEQQQIPFTIASLRLP